MMILAGDIGGTHSRLGLFDSSLINTGHEQYAAGHIMQFNNADFTQASDLIKEYLSSCGKVAELACLAIAAPVPTKEPKNDQKITLSNLPWQFHHSILKREFNLKNLCFINDFSGLPYITDQITTVTSKEEIQTLQAGKKTANSGRTELILGAGTGLGCVIAHKSVNTITILNTEAGHSDISGASSQLRDLIQFLDNNSIPLCWESLLSGHGLERLYAKISGQKPGCLRAEEISEKARLDNTSLEYQSLELLLTLTGIFSRNMALNCLTDNIYLVGNIFKIVFDIIPVEVFLRGFHNTTQHPSLLKDVSIILIKDTQVGLKGALAYAQKNLI